MSKISQRIRDWMLPVAMVTGASIYLIYHFMPEPVHRAGPFLASLVGMMQPLMIFTMLFLTFCRIEPRDLRPHRWHCWLLLVQGGLFTILGFAAYAIIRWLPGGYHDSVVLIESAMLCLICPTATAAAVVTHKLGGSIPGITTYIVLINILTAVLVPLMVPLVQPQSGVDFWTAFSMILAKVFPLLITPCLCAWLVRYLLPGFYRRIVSYPDLPFYLWAVGLALAISVTTKAIVHSDMKISLLVSMAIVSLLCCAFQFAAGRYLGTIYDSKKSGRGSKVTAGQSLGQKNTIFAIWLGYTFLTPETSIVGGFYSLWHNIYNSWQLYRAGHTSRVDK